MKLDEFISSVLVDIESGFNAASEQTGKGYSVIYGEVSQNGVSFDIAVTTNTSDSSKVEGKVKAGIIEVLGAGLGGALENSSEQSHVSRIQFSVNVPIETEEKIAERSRQIRALNEQKRQKFGL